MSRANSYSSSVSTFTIIALLSYSTASCFTNSKTIKHESNKVGRVKMQVDKTNQEVEAEVLKFHNSNISFANGNMPTFQQDILWMQH